MQRRDILKTAGGIGVGTAVGGLGVIALTGSATAAEAKLDIEDPNVATSDDGTIERVSFGGLFKFEWDGLDQEADHGWYQIETRIRHQGEDEFSNWRSHGTNYGQLGASWGGDNDHTQDTGTDGYWQFYFGETYGNEDYVIAGDGGEDMRNALNKYDTSVFNSNEDGKKKDTVVEFRYTGAVYNGDPDGDGERLKDDVATGKMTISVKNQEATATTSGEVVGNVDAGGS